MRLCIISNIDRNTIQHMAPVPHGGARTMGLGPDIIDFSASVNPLGMHPAVRETLAGSLDTAVEYPDANAAALESALAGYVGTAPDLVVAGNGATEIIHNICRMVAGSPVLVPAPTFGEYAAAARLCGSSVEHFHTMDLSEDAPRFAEAIPKGGCVFVCNPANPTGRLAPSGTILEIVKAAADASSVVVVDECFVEMTPGRNESVARQTALRDNLIVLRSMTKSFGLAGLRVGYAVADPAVSSRLRDLRATWSLNALAQVAGTEALKHTGHIAEALSLISDEVPYLSGVMDGAAGIHPYETDTNYILARTDAEASTVQGRLLKHGMLVRDCSSFEGLDSHHIRVSVRTRRENTILAGRLPKSCRA